MSKTSFEKAFEIRNLYFGRSNNGQLHLVVTDSNRDVTDQGIVCSFRNTPLNRKDSSGVQLSAKCGCCLLRPLLARAKRLPHRQASRMKQERSLPRLVKGIVTNTAY